jgi:hypothetical protein
MLGNEHVVTLNTQPLPAEQPVDPDITIAETLFLAALLAMEKVGSGVNAAFFTFEDFSPQSTSSGRTSDL